MYIDTTTLVLIMIFIPLFLDIETVFLGVLFIGTVSALIKFPIETITIGLGILGLILSYNMALSLVETLSSFQQSFHKTMQKLFANKENNN